VTADKPLHAFNFNIYNKLQEKCAPEIDEIFVWVWMKKRQIHTNVTERK
jgi:hypothetical protein